MLTQVAAKFKRDPDPGECFMFPLDGSSSNWLHARINLVTAAAVEIDANYGVQDREVELSARVVKVVRSGTSAASAGGGGGGSGTQQ